MGQPRGHPLKSWDLFDEMKWPNPGAEGRFEHLPKALEGAGDKYVMAGCGFTFFERMHYMRGMAELLLDMYENPKQVHELADRVLDIQIGFVRNYQKYGEGKIHCISMTDDWGTQNAAFVSRKMFREFFKWRYKKLFDTIHESGMHAWMHSCGHVNEIIQEWIDVGLDIINLQQPRNLGIEEIGRRYAGKICFASTVDIQATLPWKTPQQVREEAKLLLECWGTKAGGFIVAEYGDDKAIGAKPGNGKAMFEAFLEYGKLKRET
jgi:uroporphyrinogen-III decarboxylase